MQIDLIPVNKLVAINGLKEVTDPVTFESGNIPTSGGLLSKEIFGNSVKERRDTFAYINLQGKYFHPFIYKQVKKLNRDIEAILYGRKYFKVDESGDIIVSDNEEKGFKTGIDELYKEWTKIKFKRNESNIRNERIDLIEGYPRDVLFTEYWDVIPAYYRDVNLMSVDSGVVSHHEINDLYSRLLRLAQTIKEGNQFDFSLISTQARIQETLVEIYDLLKSQIEKKHGLIRKSLLGKSIDYGARSVISAPFFNANRYDELEVNFHRSGIPLAQCCSLFTPFIIQWVKNFFIKELQHMANKYPIADNEGKLVKYVKLKDPATHFNEEYIKKAIDRYVHSPANRFDRIEIPIDEKEGMKNPIYMKFVGSGADTDAADTTKTSPLVNRHATWTDILYMAAVDVTQDKHVWITRYPLLDYFGILPTKVHVMSTIKTMPMYVGEKVYTHYPVVELDMPSDKLIVNFVDTVRLSNLYLQGLGGDYDGD